MLGVSERIIEEECYLRHEAQLQMSSDFPPDDTACAQQALTDLLLPLSVTDHTVVDTGVSEITGQLDVGKGDPTNSRILHDALDHPADFVTQQPADSL